MPSRLPPAGDGPPEKIPGMVAASAALDEPEFTPVRVVPEIAPEDAMLLGEMARPAGAVVPDENGRIGLRQF